MGCDVMDQKMVSIAMATFNGEKYLRCQLDSILSQTYKNIEIVICDDCSTDNTIEILEEYRVKHGIIYYVNDKNLGYIRNFERVLGFCSGDYIALSDQDDIWLNNKIEFLVDNIGDANLIFSDSSLIDEHGRLFAKSFLEYQKISVPALSDQLNKLLFSNFVTGCTTLFKKEVVTKAVPFIDSIPHDWWIALHASVTGDIVVTKSPLILYRQHPNNTIGARKFSIIKILKNIRTRRLKVINECNHLFEITDCLKSRYTNYTDIVKMIDLEKDLCLYQKSLLNNSLFHFNACIIAWKYRNLWFNNYPELFALAKFIV
jgi:glycosyltransferase involved in cell wall biosynthesis